MSSETVAAVRRRVSYSTVSVRSGLGQSLNE